MTAIRIQQLNKTFPSGTRALINVDVTVEPGEMVALIGASGSGKSTLLRHVAGLATGDRRNGSGTIAVHGRPIQTGGRMSGNVRRSRADIGFIFQQFNLVGRLSLLTNVLTGYLGRIPSWRGVLGLFTREEKRMAMGALARVGISDYARQRASTLSGGQQQRAAIARVLVQGAKLVLADEPIASLDPASAQRVMESLATINREDGTTVVVSVHQIEYATRYCPRTIAMRAGEIVFDGPSEKLTPAFLQDLYGQDSEELILAPSHAQSRLDRAEAGPAYAMAG